MFRFVDACESNSASKQNAKPIIRNPEAISIENTPPLNMIPTEGVTEQNKALDRLYPTKTPLALQYTGNFWLMSNRKAGVVTENMVTKPKYRNAPPERK